MRKKRLRRVILGAAGVLLLVAGLLGATTYHHLVWAGETEAVSFKSGNLSIAGLLVKPSGTAAHPAVVILHGSGRGDGSHNLPGYRVHANALVRKGFAVLVYDKRGIGESDGDFSTAIYSDFVADAVAAVQFLRTREDIDPLRIGLLGASEGGWLTPEVATVAGDIAFVINKCGAPVSWQETVLFEIENDLKIDGFAPDTIREIVALRARVWKYYVDAAADDTLAMHPQRDAINAELAAIAAKVGDDRSTGLPESLPEYDAEEYARLAAKVSYDPTPFLKELDLPMLWVFAENDINIPTAKGVAVLEQLKEESSRDITTKVYPGVGHSLFSWKGVTSAGFVGGYLDLIGDWAQDHAGSE